MANSILLVSTEVLVGLKRVPSGNSVNHTCERDGWRRAIRMGTRRNVKRVSEVEMELGQKNVEVTEEEWEMC